MSFYNGKHAVQFISGSESRHSYNDWWLVPTTIPIVQAPSPRTNEVEIPGRHGKYDLSTFLGNQVIFSNVSGSWDFLVDPDRTGYLHFHSLLEDIRSFLHGYERKVILLDDPQYYYTGRLTVGKASIGANYPTISINYDLYPFKQRNDSAVTFTSTASVKNMVLNKTSLKSAPSDISVENLEAPDTAANDQELLQQTYANIEVNGTKVVTIHGYGNPIYPRIFTTAKMTMTHDCNHNHDNMPHTYVLSPGMNQINDPGCIVDYDDHTFVFTGTGLVTIEF